MFQTTNQNPLWGRIKSMEIPRNPSNKSLRPAAKASNDPLLLHHRQRSTTAAACTKKGWGWDEFPAANSDFPWQMNALTGLRTCISSTQMGISWSKWRISPTRTWICPSEMMVLLTTTGICHDFSLGFRTYPWKFAMWDPDISWLFKLTVKSAVSRDDLQKSSLMVWKPWRTEDVLFKQRSGS